MKKFILSAALAITTVTSLPAEEWTLESSELNGKGGAKAQISEDPKFDISANLNETHLIINLLDGKKKFGAPVIEVKSGENIFSLPRLTLSVPIEEIKNVKNGTPLLVSSFTFREDPYEIHLVNSGEDLPNLVITSK